METETLKSIIIEGQELIRELSITNRAITFEDDARYVFVGIRQSGKSYLMYLRAQQLIARGHSPEEMLFVNFDDERLVNFKVSDFDLILKAYASLFDHRPVIFLDEIQNIDGWEHFARRLAQHKYLTYITGSNAKMLSRDIATTLGGRYQEQFVFPYSFREFLGSKGVEVTDRMFYGQTAGAVERYLSEYFQWGGFPELQLFVNKRKWLNELYEKVLLSDVIQRNAIKNEQVVRLTVKRLAENLRTPTSFNRLAAMVKAIGHNTTPTSVSDYISALCDACIMFPVENWASKFVERNTVKKHYFMDNGLLAIFLSDSDTSLLENLCAVTLYRKKMDNSDFDFYYYNKEVEIDFYIPSIKKGIQSCFSIHNSDTLEREVKALTTFHRLYGLREAEIVTRSEEGALERDGLTISVVPLSKWLLVRGL